MKRMYLDGVGVLGPSLPSRCRILVARTVCSQSSMNSQRWANPEKGLTYRHYKDYNFPHLNHGLGNCIWRFQCLIKIFCVPASLASAFSSMIMMMLSQMALLYSNPPYNSKMHSIYHFLPSTNDDMLGHEKTFYIINISKRSQWCTSSLSIEDKKFINTLCFLGNFRQSDLKN